MKQKVFSALLEKIPVAGILLIVLSACTKKTGINPALAYTDKALFDSCAASHHHYYKNDPSAFLAGTNGPHGTFKLRFNAIAFNALTDNGKLPLKTLMPEGALVVKDVYSGGSLMSYAFMYKHSGNWLWGEVSANRNVTYSVKKDPSICTNCHSQQGNRDLIVSFNFY